MHGEYKVPGGKLVIVDLDDADGVIANARIAGDFFIEPDDALDAMNQALNGLPLTTSGEDIAAAIRAAIPADAHLLGITPEAVGVVVRRAVLGAADWGEYDFKILRPGPLPARMHVALDQVLTEEVGAGRRAPTLRFWDWEESAVVLGSFQSVQNEVDLDAMNERGVQLIRRITGGGAMFMEANNVVTYSLYVPAELVNGMSFAESYAYLDAWVLDGLQELGIDASYKPLNDITSPAGKIGGAAQKRLGTGAVLHHVTMSYDIDADAMVQVLRIGREKMSDKGTISAKKRVSPLRTQTGMSRDAIIQSLTETFVSQHGGAADALKPEEIERAEQLVREKFATDEWTFRIP